MNTLIMYGAIGGRDIRRYTLRQGLEMAQDASTREAVYGSASASSSACGFSISPDSKRAVFTRSSASTFFTWPDTSSPGTILVPAATFSGMLYACACSNAFYAIGGESPYLYVFDWATNSLISVSTSGLGSVRGIAFSPDQSKMAVVHETTPYLRVYSTTDWSYVDAPASAGGTRVAVGFTWDGSSIVTVGSQSPYLSAFDAALSARTKAITDDGYYASAWAGVTPHPLKPKSVLINGGYYPSPPYKKLYEFNLSTSTATDIIPGSSSTGCFSACVDAQNSLIYASHDWLNSRYLTAYDLSTYSVSATQNGILNNANLNSPYLRMGIARRDTARVTGTVRGLDNAPVSRTVQAFSRSSGKLLAKTSSDATSGDYTLLLPNQEPVDVRFMAADGELLNDLFYARVTPESVS